MRRAFLLLLLASGCATRSSLDTLMRQYESQGFSGTVLVAKDGRVLLHRGYGLADRARGVRNGTGTLYEIASLTKTFTAAAILQLEAEGKVQEGDPLSRFLGPFPPPKDQATIHHLVTHTAGLVPENHDLGEGIERDAFIDEVKTVAAESVPGERYRYTNAGYSVLAAIIEKVTGMPYETYIRDHIAKPVGVRDLYFRGDPLPPRFALGYIGAEQRETSPLRWGTRGAGGMISTVAELYRWHKALRADPRMKKMFVEHTEEEGYAWHVARDESGRRMIHKGGGMSQYATQIIEYPDDGVVIIWACNDLVKRWRQELNRALAAAVLEKK